MAKADLLQELSDLLGEKARRKSRLKIHMYYPEGGPLRRELYPKHLDFFRAGAEFRERCIMAANRVGKCLTSLTKIELADGNEKTLGELYASQESFVVWAWDGQKRVKKNAGPVFKKPGVHDCVRVTLRSGRWFEGADNHRIFCSGSTWRGLSELLPGLFSCPPAPTGGFYPRDSPRGGAHLFHTSQDSPGNYSASLHQYDARPLSGEESAPVSPPLRADAPQHTAVSSRLDGREGICTNTPRSVFARLSNQDAAPRDEGQRLESLSRAVCTTGESSPDHAPLSPRLSTAGVSGFQSAPAADLHGDEILFACEPPLVFEDAIIAAKRVDCQEVYDFEVADLHNYITAGVVHHNSEGIGGYELTLHATGIYPEWWEGFRFTSPIRGWVCGDTGKTVRDINQFKLLGAVGSFGTGLIPGDNIIKTTMKPGVPDAVETIQVAHISGGQSTLVLKSYDQGRISYQGTEQHVIWLDEEPPHDIYTECVMRTAATEWFPGGMILCTFTPLKGISDVVMMYLPGGRIGTYD